MKPVSNLILKMTLAPVIGGSERQGFGKYSLCSETKKEQIERPSRRIPSPTRAPKIHNKSELNAGV